jgi:putative hydrolase of the HAD superfamily
MIKGIKHIIFDLGNVLLNIDPTLTYLALKDLGISNVDLVYQKLNEQFIFEKFETNDISSKHFVDVIKTEARIPLEDEEIINAWNALILDFPLRRLQILQQLQLHYDLVLLSNTNEIHETYFNQLLQQRHGIPNIGVFFDKVYLSHRVGLRKPNSKIYERVIADCGFNPSNTLFIDDLEQNIQAAANLGIQTIWLTNGMTIEKDIFLPKENDLKS